MEKSKISIVVPCFNEKEALPLFYDKVMDVIQMMERTADVSF